MGKSTWLLLPDRKRIEEEYNAGVSVRKIAEGMGRHFSVIYRELPNGFTGEMDKNGRPGYSANLAQEKVYKERMSRKRTKIQEVGE